MMNCLDRATITGFDAHWEIRLDFRFDLVRSGDSLAVTCGSRSGDREVGIRVERGRVVDVAVWDGARRTRATLPFESAVLGVRELVCVVPRSLLPPESMVVRVQLNGALVGLATASWAEPPPAGDCPASAGGLTLAGA